MDRNTFTDDQIQWRQRQQREDEERERFYSEINQFPNLLQLKESFKVKHRNERLLERQMKEVDTEQHQYPLERARCQNFVVFLLFLLDRKTEALDYCEKMIEEEQQRGVGGGSLETACVSPVTTLTTLAVLQWELGQKEKSEETISILRKLRSSPDFKYQVAVATAEQGYAYISYGPKYFLCAIDMFESAVQQCETLAKYPNGASTVGTPGDSMGRNVRGSLPDEASTNMLLWKFDLALAIRRNFNVFAFSEHSKLSAPNLARRGVELLRETSAHSPSGLYRARSLVELANLISHLGQFKNACKQADKAEIAELCREDHMELLRQALEMPEGREDSYVLRTCGRFYSWDKKFDEAIKFLLKAKEKRDEAIVNQVLAKTLLAFARWSKRSMGRGRGDGGGRRPRGRGQRSSQPSWRGGRGWERAQGPQYQAYGRPQSGRGGPAVGNTAGSVKHMLRLARNTYETLDPADPKIQQVEQYYLRALELDQYNHGVIYDAGLLYLGMNKWETALHYFQKIVATSDPYVGSLHLVNSYEQAGLCLLEMSEEEERSPEEKRQLVSRAEEMLKGCVRECRQAMVNLPGLRSRRSHLWESYSRLRWTLQKGSGEGGTSQLERRSGVHQMLDEYLEGLQVYKDVHQISTNVQDRKRDLLQLINRYIGENRENEAKFVFDLFLSSDKCDVILNGDDEVSKQLRQTAVNVYTNSARDALSSGLLRDARLAFQGALLVRGLIKGDRPAETGEEGEGLAEDRGGEQQNKDEVEVCVFDDREAGLAAQVSTALASIIRNIFGMSVSLNDEKAPPQLLRFEGELQLARSATAVLLVLSHGEELSPRMAYLANAALDSTRDTHGPGKRVLPVIVSTPAVQSAPYPLQGLPVYADVEGLMQLAGEGVDLAAHCDQILSLFQLILTGANDVA